MPDSKCFFCDTILDVSASQREALKSKTHFDCSRCGRYSIHDLLYNQIDFEKIKDAKAILSYWIRQNQNDKKPPFLDIELVQKILKDIKLPDVNEQISRLIMYLGEVSSSGEIIDVKLNNIVSRIGSRDKESLLLIFDHLNSEKLIDILKPSIGKESLRNKDVRIVRVNLSIPGWTKFKELSISNRNVDGQFKFKEYKISKDEELWLRELLKVNFNKINPKHIKVKIWNKVSKDFKPDKLDRRLARENRLTLLGLWYIDPVNPLIGYCSNIMARIKTLLLNNPDLDIIDSFVIGSSLNILRREVEICLTLLSDFRFFNGGQSEQNESIFNKVYLTNDQSAFDRIMAYNNLDEIMENYFIENDPRKNEKLPKANTNAIKIFVKDKNVWNDISNEFNIDKRSFGKKINFVKVKYKKGIIFRDIEDSYVLAKNGFSKSAVILAGSVIEELLRLYLKEKGFTSCKTFEDYIKICEDKRFLNKGISRLSDSVRHFRNLVHLEKENSQKDSISKSIASGAISSIFTIINDF